LFSMSFSVLGCILGFLAGFRLFPAAISGAYSMMYVLPKTVTPFRPQIALLAGSVTIGSILAATLWACWGEFRAAPAELLVPKAPAAGKRIWMEYITPLWRRIPFTHKVTFRNLFRYKKRFFMTVVGVAGCSALLVTGFGLRDSIRDIVDLQFGEINRFELTIMTDDAEYAAAPDGALGELLSSDAVTGALPVFEESGKAEANGEGGSVTILVPSRTGDLDTFLSLRERKSGTALPLTDGGVILTEKLCETMGISVGDAVTIENNDGKRAETHLIGIAENYITAYAYLSPACYEELFGSAPACATLLCTLASDADTEHCITAALEDEHAFYAGSSRSIKETFADSIKSIDAVVFVLIAASGLLSMVVLYNLTNVNICERRKELATIRVLGFHENETERYIFRETNLLSFIGAFVGLFVGIWLHSYVVRTVEVEQVMFGRTIAPLSYVYAMLISIVFTLIVNRIMRRQVRSVDMVEAMKAND
ncbi:MAG: ABC transporter permease, partial [Clostridia bacterium]|nr:ABC transporter permease [Clostridia bacterium]